MADSVSLAKNSQHQHFSNVRSRVHFRLAAPPLSLPLLLLLLALAVLVSPVSSRPQLITYRLVDGAKTAEGRFVILAGESANLTIFGTGLTNSTIIKFTSDSTSCSVSNVDLIGGGMIQLPSTSSNNVANTSSSSDDPPDVQRAYLPVLIKDSTTLYFCLFEDAMSSPEHQGSEAWLVLEVQASFLPLAAEIIFIIVLMVLSGLFSGLNLGLMSLDPTTLKIVTESGTKRQRIYAKIIYRVRRHGNYLLCTLLLGNVLVNSTLTILLDEVLPSGIYAVIASTLAIVIFGEIIPQAICSRHGLVVGAWTIPLTLVFMILTFPLSFPLSLILNLVLGKEIGSVYNRDQLLKLLHVTKEHHDLENDEVDIISGVLGYKKKLARDVMTKSEDIFCISIDGVLDFNTMKEIYESGYSRIPVYVESRENIVHLLYVRDLAFVDPDDKTPLASHIQFYQHELLFFFEDTPLDEILKGFLEGKCHLGVIQTVKEVPDKDPVYAAIGVITLEDIVEEILQRQIVDETDRYVDNRSFKPRASARAIDVGFAEAPTNSLTSQQRLAVYQFLSTEVEPFTSKYMTSAVLKRLLTQNIVQSVSCEEYKQRNLTLFSMGSSAPYFCLVLEGCVEVEIGKDSLKFESRSFSHFGSHALVLARGSPHHVEYRPDFTARPVTDCLLVIITSAQYMAARRASVFEGGRGNSWTPPRGGGGSGKKKADFFSTEWDKAETVDLSSTRKKGMTVTSSSFQLGFLSSSKQSKLAAIGEGKSRKSPDDELRLLSHDGQGYSSDSSGHSSGGGVSPISIRVELTGGNGTGDAGTTAATTSQVAGVQLEHVGAGAVAGVAGMHNVAGVAGYIQPSILENTTNL